MTQMRRRSDSRDPALVLEEREEILAPVIEGQRIRQRRERLEESRRQRMLHVKLASAPKRLEVKQQPKRSYDMSKESIIQDLPEYFVRLMRNWARSGSANPFAMSRVYEGAQTSSGYAESTIPVLVGDAGNVNDALQRVPERERLAVRLFWECEGRSMSWLGRRLGGISYHTAEQRVRAGHGLLRTELDGLKMRSDKYRQEARFLGAMS